MRKGCTNLTHYKENITKANEREKWEKVKTKLQFELWAIRCEMLVFRSYHFPRLWKTQTQEKEKKRKTNRDKWGLTQRKHPKTEEELRFGWDLGSEMIIALCFIHFKHMVALAFGLAFFLLAVKYLWHYKSNKRWIILAQLKPNVYKESHSNKKKKDWKNVANVGLKYFHFDTMFTFCAQIKPWNMKLFI